jgi:hypothetical protein
MCVTGNKYVDLAIGVAAVAVTAGAAAPVVAPAIGATAFNVGVGAALGATTAGALGNDPLQGAVLGGITGGVFGPADPQMVLGGTAHQMAVESAVVMGGVGATAMDFMTPETPDMTGYTPVSQYAQQYNSQQIATTGSGGRQAAASLAEAVQRSRQRKLSQEDVGDLSIDTSAFASTGLQLA